MSSRVGVRTATLDDVDAVSRIGGPGMLAQYAGLVDPAAVEAAADQLYRPEALAECIGRCEAASRAEFLVAAQDDRVVGFLHFDDFGPEPELHRLYVDAAARGAGAGSLLMDELHRRLPPHVAYMLLVVEGNDRAVAFYERHGLAVESLVDGLHYYATRMNVQFPDGTRPFRLILMRAGPRERDPRQVPSGQSAR